MDDAACVEKALKVGTDLFGNLSTAAALPATNNEMAFPSPVKEALAEADSPKNYPCYDFDSVDDTGKHWIRFKPAKKVHAVFVNKDDL